MPVQDPLSENEPFDKDHRGKAAMEVLARELANNYFDVSVGYSLRADELLEQYKRVFPRHERDYKDVPRVRNIVLVGAGGSYAAFGGQLFPLAKDAVNLLRDKLGVLGLRDALGKYDTGDPNIRDRFAEEEQIFRQLYSVPNPHEDFETQLAILSKFYTPRQIRGALKKIYDLRYYPHILFDTIAHLLKHRFVDAVISYNFDEVLDQAILEELREGEYRYVVSDGDAVDDLRKIMFSDTLKVPLYIKPHGTITHKSSLRFTKDEYVGMPNDLLQFTRKILLGHTRNDHNAQEDQFSVNLISIGFAFTSVELIELLRNHPSLRIFHINLATGNNPGQLTKEVRNLKSKEVHNLKDAEIEQYLIGIDPDAAVGGDENWHTVTSAIRALFETAFNRFDEIYRPRHLSRHEIVHALLFKEDTKSGKDRQEGRPLGCGDRIPADDRDYFYARLCVELALALLKGNGRIDLTTLVEDRVGIYYGKWRSCETRTVRSLREICKTAFNLSDSMGFRSSIFDVKSTTGVPEERKAEFDRYDRDRRYLPGTHEFAYYIWKLLVKALQEVKDRDFRDHIKELDAEIDRIDKERQTADNTPGSAPGLVRFFARMLQSDVQELAPRFTPEAHLLLNVDSPDVIHTNLGMTMKFFSILEDPRWDLLLSVSEVGKAIQHANRFFAQPRAPNLPRRRASLVVTDTRHPQLVEERLKKYRNKRWLIGDNYLLPYWAHNDHMLITLRMSMEEGVFEPLAAISYQRRGLENRINPVYIQHPEDLEILLQIYFAYVVKAEGYMLPGAAIQDADGYPVRGAVPTVNQREAQERRQELQKKWWNAMRSSASRLERHE